MENTKETVETDDESTESPTEPVVNRIDKGDVFLEEAAFRGDKSAFHFWIPQVKDIEGAVRWLTRDGEDGKKVIVTLINSNLAFKVRAKANSKIKTEAEVKLLLDKNEILLIDQDEALAFMPGEKEITSANGLWRAYQENLKFAKEAKDNNKIEEARQLFAKAKQYFVDFNRKVASQEEEILANIGS